MPNDVVSSMLPAVIGARLLVDRGLSSFELHHLIMWTITRFGIAPPATPAEVARGRTIGYLERPIVFLLIITGNVVSLGLVFAAKTLTRFAKLNNRAFAKYYLIGTLLRPRYSVAFFLRNDGRGRAPVFPPERRLKQAPGQPGHWRLLVRCCCTSDPSVLLSDQLPSSE